MNRSLLFQQYLTEHATRVEQALQDVFPPNWEVPDVLRQSAQYSLLAGGKRLRPVLVIAATEALGGNMESALPVASAIEMIHTYSLVHDDLPAMDNDDYRRGKLTNHKVYGEAMAILAGDALLTHAFYLVAQTASQHRVPASQVLQIIEELSMYAGAKGMVGGQVADILAEQGLTELAQLEYIHIHKTSDLIVFCLRAGGILAGASSQQLEDLTQFGLCLGLAFQIQDDILDCIGDEKKIGKPLKSDESKKKVTFPYFIGLEASERRVVELTEQAKAVISNGRIHYPERLLQLADYLMKRDH